MMTLEIQQCQHFEAYHTRNLRLRKLKLFFSKKQEFSRSHNSALKLFHLGFARSVSSKNYFIALKFENSLIGIFNDL